MRTEFLDGNPERKGLLARPEHRLEDNITGSTFL
jgi:hypothetical protein